MTGLCRATWAECLKLRRTLALRLAAAAPLAELGLLLGVGLARPEVVFRNPNLATQFVRPIMTVWTIILLPSVVAITAALVAGLDHDEHHWDQIFALPIGRESIYGAKWLLTAGLVALSSAVLLVAGLGAMELLRLGVGRLRGVAVPAGLLAQMVMRSDAAAVLLISVLYWVSLRWRSFVAPLGVGAVGIMSTIIFLNASARFATFWPWTEPVLAAPGRLAWPLWWPLALGVIAGGAAGWNLSRREI